MVRGVLTCRNTSCISNAGEPVETEFEVLEDGVRCTYCDTIIRENLTDHIHT